MPDLKDDVKVAKWAEMWAALSAVSLAEQMAAKKAAQLAFPWVERRDLLKVDEKVSSMDDESAD